MNAEEFENIYKLEETHWWYRTLDDIVEEFIRRNIGNRQVKIFDAGCGTCRLLSKLQKYGDVAGIDNSESAINFCKTKNIVNIKKIDLNEWHEENEYDIIVSLDVLYHKTIKSVDAVIASFYQALNSNGILIMNLPAFNLLKRLHDKVVGGDKRFRKNEVENMLRQRGFDIQFISYRLPFAFLGILVKKLFFSWKKKAKSDLSEVIPVLNQFLYFIHKVENKLLINKWHLPFGSSLFVVAIKKS